MRVLITGASGFLGRHLAAGIAAAGWTPVALSIDAAGLAAGVEHHTVDVRDRAAVAAAVGAAAPDAVVHLAALSHVGESWRRIPDYYAVNVLGSEHVLDAARGRRILFASSAEVYGDVPESEQPIVEGRELAPRSPYALTKAVGERLALAANATVVRMFNLLGPGQAVSFALPSFAGQLAAIAAGEREGVLRVGNLEARRDFVHVHDAVDALCRLLAVDSRREVFNIASGRALSIAEALAALCAVSGVTPRIEVDRERLRPADLPLLKGDGRRLAALGWTPARGVEAALSELWQEARQRPRSAP